MSEETEDQIAENTQDKGENTDKPNNDKPAGYAPIDVKTASPEEIQERLNYLYSQVKDSKRTMGEYRKITAEQSKLLGELQNGVGAVVNHLQDKTFSDNEAALTAKRNAAYEAGDTKAYHEAQDKLDDLRLEKKMAEKVKPVKQEAPKNNDYTGYDDPEDEAFVDSWQAEKDESGTRLRPWAFGNHPRHHEALIETEAVMKSPRWKDKTMQQKLAEVDRRMGVEKVANKQNVIGGSFTASRKTAKVTISPRQEQIAIRTKIAGPKASDAEHIERYRKQIEKLQSGKGAR